MTEDKITEISCIADDSCKVFLLGVKEVFLEVKEVREVKEVKAITFFVRSYRSYRSYHSLRSLEVKAITFAGSELTIGGRASRSTTPSKQFLIGRLALCCRARRSTSYD